MTTTKIELKDNVEGDFSRVIDIHEGKIDIDAWANTLEESDRSEWWRLKKLHEAVVDRAVDAGICIRSRESIKWTSKDEHNQWFDKYMDPIDHENYKLFWERYWASNK